MSDITKDSCPRCGSLEKAWMEKSMNGQSKCAPCGLQGLHSAWIKMVVEEKQSEAERLADAYKSQGLKNSWRVNFKTGFRAGEKSEKVMRLVEALKFYSVRSYIPLAEIINAYETDGSTAEAFSAYTQKAAEAIAAFNASPEEG